MSDHTLEDQKLDVEVLREAIQEEYAEVAANPHKGFRFHTGRPLVRMLEYADEWLDGIPESSIESFAGTGNPFSLGEIHPGERVVDVGCGAGIDSLIAAKKVGPDGQITWRADVFSGAPQAGSAANYGTLGINFRARKATDEQELAAALAAPSSEIPNSAAGEEGT